MGKKDKGGTGEKGKLTRKAYEKELVKLQT
jgi:hypothetical protein